MEESDLNNVTWIRKMFRNVCKNGYNTEKVAIHTSQLKVIRVDLGPL